MTTIFTTPVNVLETFDFASNLFKQRNLKYGNFEYSKHLIDVFNVGVRHIHLLNISRCDKQVQNSVLNALICHDTLEDCGINYNDLKKQIGSFAADIVYDVTNELGKNREERSKRTYSKIKNNELAVFVKCCDRLANVRFAKTNSFAKENALSSMYKKYVTEYQSFKNELFDNPLLRSEDEIPFQELWNKLDKEHEVPDHGRIHERLNKE